MNVTSLQRRVRGLMVREVEGEILILDTESDRIHQLNRTASFIWSRCDGSSAGEIAVLLALEFDVEQHTALDDVIEALALLRSLRIVE